MKKIFVFMLLSVGSFAFGQMSFRDVNVNPKAVEGLSYVGASGSVNTSSTITYYGYATKAAFYVVGTSTIIYSASFLGGTSSYFYPESVKGATILDNEFVRTSSPTTLTFTLPAGTTVGWLIGGYQ